MSPETRKKVVFAIVALVVVAMVLASTGCTTSDDSGNSTPTNDTYPAAMDEICAATASELDAVPDPPEQISRVDWAAEVSRLLDNEANRFDALRVDVDQREQHGSLVRTAREQAAQFALLGDVLDDDALDDDAPDSVGIEAISDEIRSLSLGREELASELGVPTCGTRALT